MVTKVLGGEICYTDEDLAFLFEKHNDQLYKEYFMMFYGLEEMMKDSTLNGTDWRVFMRLCSDMAEGGWSNKRQKAIADELLTYEANVNASIKKLTERGYITKERHPKTDKLCLRVAAAIAGRGKWSIRRARRAISQRITKVEIQTKTEQEAKE